MEAFVVDNILKGNLNNRLMNLVANILTGTPGIISTNPVDDIVIIY